MKVPTRMLAHRWTLPLAVVLLIAGPAILYYILSHAGLPAALVSGIVILMAIKHLGLAAVFAGPLYALLRRRSRQ